jgi:hypothetical protein
MKLLTLILMVLAASCASEVTREDGRVSSGLSKVGQLQIEDFEWAATRLIKKLQASSIFDEDEKIAVLFRIKPNGNQYTGLVDLSLDAAHNRRMGYDRLLFKFVRNDLLNLCDFVDQDDLMDHSVKILLTNEYQKGDKKWIGKTSESNRIVMHFEVWATEAYSQKLVFSASEFVQKRKN